MTGPEDRELDRRSETPTVPPLPADECHRCADGQRIADRRGGFVTLKWCECAAGIAAGQAAWNRNQLAS